MTITKEYFNKFLNHVPSISLIIFGFIFYFVGLLITGPGLVGDSPGMFFINLGNTPLLIGQILLATGFIAGFLKLIRQLFKFNRYLNSKK